MGLLDSLNPQWGDFSGGFDPTAASAGLGLLANMFQRPKYSTNIADVTGPDNTGFQNTIQAGLLMQRARQQKLAEAQAKQQMEMHQAQLEDMRRKQAAQDTLQGAITNAQTGGPASYQVNGLPALPDAPGGSMVSAPKYASPLDSPDVLKAYAGLNPAGYIQELQAQRSEANKMQFAPQGSDVYVGRQKVGSTGNKPPEGYVYGGDGKLTFIPGGPADPKQAGALSMARNPVIPVEVDNGDGTKRIDYVLKQSIFDPATQSYVTKDVKVGSTPAAPANGQAPKTPQVAASINQGARSPVKPEERALDAEAQGALEPLRKAKFINDDGGVNRSLVAQVWAGIPGTEGSALRTSFDQAFSNMTYLKTGKAATNEELQSARARYLPHPLDSASRVKTKMTGLTTFLDSYSASINPTKGKGANADPLGLRP